MTYEDRTVYAERAGHGEIVRYDRAGHWFYESYAGKRSRLSIREAAETAIKWESLGGRVFYDLPGGRNFYSIVRLCKPEKITPS